MRRFHFPLERALGYKARRERIAELNQAQRLAEKQKRDAEVKKILELIDAGARSLLALVGSGINPITWFATRNHAEQLTRRLKAAQEEAQRAARDFEIARDEYRVAAQEAEALRILRQAQLDEFRQARDKADQTHLDEMSLRLWRQEHGEEEEGGP